ncbi:sodium- and chloride-dependent glycine transporter 2-like [Plakobranchus ocellatus]|uniref:Sodium- and chloride-dependent glycine transporter 2-like n=1 Tax=Plakobranchus ocellatus TaxID=259542 RepID=A0AAV4B0E6_9GAST|nr:sodium- and chloride-dependent glycine transporter 2-like [Plakobranchus ocellatus]
MGIPLFCLEILFGQFASRGPINIWEINLLFKGLGITLVILSAVVSIYYNIVVATAIYFMFASMQDPLPWETCGNEWNTCNCRTFDMNTTLPDPLMWYNKSGLDCILQITSFCCTMFISCMPSNTSCSNSVLEITDGIQTPGMVKWDITLCNLLAWIVICLALISGVKSMGKAGYFTALMPYVLLTILVVRGVTLKGASKGLDFYLNPDVSKLRDSKVWKQAAAQIFFSLSCCTGSLTAMSSYNKFNNNFISDSIVIPIINCMSSFFAGFAIFSVLGFMSYNTGISVDNVTTTGPGLTFVAYPEALAQMPVPQLWSVLFFFMVACLGMGTQFPSVETVLTGIQDEYPTLIKGRKRLVFRIGTCVLGFLLGIPQTTQGGFYLLEWCDIFIGWPLLLVGFFQVLAIVWIYGVKRFSEDVYLMIGQNSIAGIIFRSYFLWAITGAIPLLLLVILAYDIYDYTPITGPAYPEWSEALGWIFVFFIMVWVPAWYVGKLFLIYRHRKTSDSFWTILKKANQPTAKWGPRDPKNRTIPRYQLPRDEAELELRPDNSYDA